MRRAIILMSLISLIILMLLAVLHFLIIRDHQDTALVETIDPPALVEDAPIDGHDIALPEALDPPEVVEILPEMLDLSKKEEAAPIGNDDKEEPESLPLPKLEEKVTANDNNTILLGLLNLPRQVEAGPVDGCKRPQKGLTLGGGFLLIACEKLLPDYPIDLQDKVAEKYSADLLEMGWDIDVSDPQKNVKRFVRRDDLGCTSNLSMMVWKDRSMNEVRLPNTGRNDHRQIVFITKFEGQNRCEHYYDTVKKLAGQP